MFPSTRGNRQLVSREISWRPHGGKVCVTATFSRSLRIRVKRLPVNDDLHGVSTKVQGLRCDGWQEQPPGSAFFGIIPRHALLRKSEAAVHAAGFRSELATRQTPRRPSGAIPSPLFSGKRNRHCESLVKSSLRTPSGGHPAHNGGAQRLSFRL
jgi:hypothetical protein